MIKKADLILAAAFIIAGLAASYLLTSGSNPGKELEISSQGRLYGTYSLLEDRTIRVETSDGHFNVVCIRDGSAYVRKSDCAGQDCVHSHEISRNGETIVCLPNKLLLEVKGGEKAYDSISK
ncbi:MAG: NusG domain II-containing protein [Clostridiales bacterium]|nr:NusG domain II-containing protein [Clostridiales bacterium]MDD7034945.1 NusG domain II-containing protein [Bacillota bacterium]MDY2920294.1 NusG domain II-containing protein [Lentihominibacter sp.]